MRTDCDVWILAGSSRLSESHCRYVHSLHCCAVCGSVMAWTPIVYRRTARWWCRWRTGRRRGTDGRRRSWKARRVASSRRTPSSGRTAKQDADNNNNNNNNNNNRKNVFLQLLNQSIIRPHRSTTYFDATYCYKPRSLSVCQSVTVVIYPAKTAQTDRDMEPFGLRIRVGPRNCVLDGVQIPSWKGAILRGGEGGQL